MRHLYTTLKCCTNSHEQQVIPPPYTLRLHQNEHSGPRNPQQLLCYCCHWCRKGHSSSSSSMRVLADACVPEFDIESERSMYRAPSLLWHPRMFYATNYNPERKFRIYQYQNRNRTEYDKFIYRYRSSSTLVRYPTLVRRLVF